MPPKLIAVFDDEVVSGAKRTGFYGGTAEQKQAWLTIVNKLKEAGLLSPTTSAPDVDVPRIIREGNQLMWRSIKEAPLLAHEEAGNAPNPIEALIGRMETITDRIDRLIAIFEKK